MTIYSRVKRKFDMISTEPNIMNNHRVVKEFGVCVGKTLKWLNVVDALTGYRTSFYKKKISSFIEKDFEPLLNEYRKQKCIVQNVDSNKKMHVWVLWWQGLDCAPDVVRECIRSQQRNLNSEQYEYHLLTENSVWNYVSLSDNIKTKYNNGQITLTHLSDIIRANLLANYGGIWIDATIYMSDSFPEEVRTVSFYSNRKNLDSMNQRKMISSGRWTSYFMKAERGNKLLKFMCDAFELYWEKHNALIDYWLVDYTIYAAYKNIPAIREEIDLVPYNNQNIFNLFVHRNEPYDEQKFSELTKNTILHKQSYKYYYTKIDEKGSLTNWGYVCKGEEHES